MLSFPSEWCILLTEPFESTNAIKKTGIISLYLLFIAIALYGFIQLKRDCFQRLWIIPGR
ncbi:hypothetical protein HH620_002005 [Escherichia coli]|uniref:Uncharacterized protein n=3 Tax=Escherichia coli TaxID=562 RepID=A0AAN1ADS2_ECO57|nr:conserved hypothetical protein [Escherichia coli O157:H7 str. EC4115]ADD58974.1 hypothetical protein G2583_4510 [Escherichia coli O55:H7 str. CB9615]AFJ31444.1 hypothetical protein CDCO157_4392 [Escherichia coli Xuzhou21]AIF96351.1 hypothetical protein SS17_4835 [Escherichia coli O157:H7 str. SS17]AIG71184.1 hypothetical protein EDL933_5044 [Escherichia coli O157:H7 str. EDL933]ALH93038.1 hypothetical protein AO055_23455 [Escherichia coli O157:H7]AMW43559.1 hypothetical protein ARC77_15510